MLERTQADGMNELRLIALRERDEWRKRAEIAERDAARYRWLRDGNYLMVCTASKLPKEWYLGTALDAELDAALSSTGEGSGG